MADKAISELVAAEDIGATDLFVLQQNNTAKKLPGQVLLNWLTRAADGHGGIQSWVTLKTEGLVTTFRVTLTDQTYIDIDVVDGRGVEDVQKVKTEGLVDTYQIIYNDGSFGTFKVTNGAKGDKGDNAEIWVRYASQKPTSESNSFGEVPDAWVGLASGHLSSAPTDWQAYTWYQWKGEKGDAGDPAVLVSSSVEYQVSDSGTIIPSGAWSASIPIVPQGRYLWTRTTKTFNTGSPVVSYSVSRMGLDGSGSVSSVANISPDENGNVPLRASDVGALPNTGGDLTGALRMNGQPISGLNAPTESDQAANMRYVNQQVKNAAPRDLLINSDFTNPVNPSGKTSWDAGGECISGWTMYSGDATKYGVSLTSDGLKCNNHSVVRQNLPINVVGYDLLEAEYTLALWRSDGTVRISHTGIYTNSNRTNYTVPLPDGTWAHASLFEGIYTEETVPRYQAKGYVNESFLCKTLDPVTGEYVPYPVGSIYMSVNSTSPASLFGGTWEQLKDRFLLGAGSSYSAGGTGGAATHKLTVNEMPSHTHNIKTLSSRVASGSDFARIASDGTGVSNVILDTGGGAAHNNMPPYLAVYMWKRIA